jgi:hypothetical protein
MAEIIRTWPASDKPQAAAQLFHIEPGGLFYFTLGRGKPKQEIEKLWFTYCGRIIGYFRVLKIVTDDEVPDDLHFISEPKKHWAPRKHRWVAVCKSGCVRAPVRVFMGGFRGWRYFDFEAYRGTPEARCRF